MVLLQLGDLQFDLKKLNFSEMSETYGYNFSKEQGIKGSEFLQFLGKSNATFTIKGEAFTAFNNPQKSLDKLVKMANSGRAYRMLLSDGKNLGLFVITNLTVEKKHFNNFGQNLKTSFNLSLLKTS